MFYKTILSKFLISNVYTLHPLQLTWKVKGQTLKQWNKSTFSNCCNAIWNVNWLSIIASNSYSTWRDNYWRRSIYCIASRKAPFPLEHNLKRSISSCWSNEISQRSQIVVTPSGMWIDCPLLQAIHIAHGVTTIGEGRSIASLHEKHLFH